MLRGHKKLFISLLENPTSESATTKTVKKGRNEHLHTKRNELLIYRYYYHTRVVSKQYQDALDEMETEFFISKRTIVDIVLADPQLLKEINAANLCRKTLKEKYPFMNWA